jgi:polyphosphate glucokinase
MSDSYLGIDIGGTGMKAAPVDLTAGRLAADRMRIETPHPAVPDAMAAVVAELVEHFSWKGAVGVAFPAVVKGGVALTAANLDHAWIGRNVEELFASATGRPVTVTNDADAAGVAEMAFGAGRGQPGVVFMATLGTGIGSALFVDGRLVPNTELGHLVIRDKDSERRAAAIVREKKQLSWTEWAARVDEYLHYVEALLSPDLIIIGGGVSRKGDKFIPLLDTRADIVAATLANQAGIVGAALTARAAARAAVRRRRSPARQSTGRKEATRSSRRSRGQRP